MNWLFGKINYMSLEEEHHSQLTDLKIYQLLTYHRKNGITRELNQILQLQSTMWVNKHWPPFLPLRFLNKSNSNRNNLSEWWWLPRGSTLSQCNSNWWDCLDFRRLRWGRSLRRHLEAQHDHLSVDQDPNWPAPPRLLPRDDCQQWGQDDYVRRRRRLWKEHTDQ